MTIKNNRAAQAILDREPTAAEQVTVNNKQIGDTSQCIALGTVLF